MNAYAIGAAAAGLAGLGLWFLIPVFLWMVWKYS